MKRFLVAGITAAAFCGAPAIAADMPVKAPVYRAAAPYNWTGFYWGVNAGVGVSTMNYHSIEELGTNGDFDAGFTGGLQAGYNWQYAPNWVFGVEGDVGYLGTNRSFVQFNDPTFFNRVKTDFYSTLRARYGYAWDRSLLYATGGVAFVHIKDSVNDVDGANDPGAKSATKTGLAVGGGLETALFGNWTTKVEYLFIDAGKIRTDDIDNDEHGTWKHQFHVIKFGLNYKFGDPLVAASSNMPVKAPIAAVHYNWTGFYAGVNAGVGVAGTTFFAGAPVVLAASAGSNDLHDPGFTGGLQYGYNWQLSPNWVIGTESDLGYLGNKRSITDFNDGTPGAAFVISAKSDFYTTTRARLGYAWDRSLLYATAGLAGVHIKDRFEDFSPADVGSKSKTKYGLTVGGGLETALAGNWSTKVEYLFIDPGKITVAEDVDSATFKHQFHIFRFGLNYKFGDIWSKSPVVAKY
jgi:outer membrane immunogenic protein